MYVIESGTPNQFIKFTGNHSVDTYQAALTQASRFQTIRAALDAIQRNITKTGLPMSTIDGSGGLNILKLVITPGGVTRREVPLGTVGSKVAIKSGHGSAIYFGTRPLDTLYPEGFQRDIQQALLFTSVSAATAHYVKLARNDACWTTNITLVDILEETTPETLTTTPLE